MNRKAPASYSIDAAARGAILSPWARISGLHSLVPFLALLAATAMLRLPSFFFGILNIDETDFLLIARKMFAGGIPYVDAVETKPPLAYLAYLPGALLGFQIWPMRVLGIFWAFATCIVLKKAGELWTGRSDVGWCAALLALLASCCDLPAINAELLLNLPAAIALYFFIRAERENRQCDWAWIGVWTGVATLFKHQAGILLVSMVLAQLFRKYSRPANPSTGYAPGMRRALLIGAGFILPWAAAALLYARAGELRAFYEWNIERNLHYVGGGGSEHRWERFAHSFVLCILAGTALPWVLSTIESARRGDPIRAGLRLTLWTTWIPVWLGGRFYEHYYQQFVPALALLGAPLLADLLERWATLTRTLRAALAAALLLPPLGLIAVQIWFGFAKKYPSQNPKVVELAAWISKNSAPSETLFIWGHYSPIYYLAHRDAGTRYLNTSLQMGNFDPQHLPPDFDLASHISDRDVSTTLQDLDANRPALVVDTSPADIHGWSRIPISQFPRLADYIHAHYTLVGRPAGADVYRRDSDGAKL